MKLERLIGFHAVRARLARHPDSIVELYVLAAREDQRMRDLLAAARAAQLEPKRVDAARLDALAQGERHQGVIALAEPAVLTTSLDALCSEAERRAVPPLLLVLDQVQDPHNFGAAMRSAAAFGVDAVIVPRHGSAPRSAAAHKAASGAFEMVPIIEVTNLAQALETLKQHGLWVYGAQMGAEETLFTAELTGPLAWVLGSEGHGLRRLTRERCDRLVAIPISGAIESLNVSVAAAVCLYATQAARQAAASGVPGAALPATSPARHTQARSDR
ncbi:MAG: 23S rRNA (guanosine(2251)-2'-O)-methyltransferase RlmB [Casimicrobiaceae bacterium]|nr:23S rRNA (guanosine(2251)-2'-O)-methyltransferase RlmB [Casimicrobiaceae bacterium]MCX8097841.1 23S rRNA (guanosine(2251)-2'-O)-methyltransferase RlmB [Casimicrobiaceae bacterium]MDW8311369.1 23S rRNA (guanosine(2251)-2'-O)-methyltransferase RlmB [Burkholderiales bacterium]